MIAVFIFIQDVSEFMIKLIDYLEGCFKQKCQTIENSGNANSGNPVVDMFYGKFTVKGSNAGINYSSIVDDVEVVVNHTPEPMVYIQNV